MNVTFVSKTKAALTFMVSMVLTYGVNYLLNVPPLLSWIAGIIAGHLWMSLCLKRGWIR